MDLNARPSLQGLKVVSFESRRAKEMAELIRRYGGEPVSAPSMREVPLSDNRAALDFFPELEAGKFEILILLTGVGTRSLTEILLTRYSRERILSGLKKTRLVARGPKPVAALKELGLVPALIVPEPNTWREVLSALEGAAGFGGKHIAVQEYGIPNPELVSGLERRGATVKTVPIYRWALPDDLEPLRSATQKLLNREIDVALFTNGAQVDHLFRVAGENKLEEALRSAFTQVVISSVGPVCTEVLENHGLKPDIQPTHPKMGSLIADVASSARRILATKRIV
jgi:uroporphyrinogen-III synthase